MAVKNDDLAMAILLLYSNYLKPLMKNVLKLSDHGQTHFKNIAVNAERFLKCVYFTTLCFIGLIVQSFQGRIFAIKIFHKFYVWLSLPQRFFFFFLQSWTVKTLALLQISGNHCEKTFARKKLFILNNNNNNNNSNNSNNNNNNNSKTDNTRSH